MTGNLTKILTKMSNAPGGGGGGLGGFGIDRYISPSNPRETTNVDVLVHGHATGDLGQMHL